MRFLFVALIASLFILNCDNRRDEKLKFRSDSLQLSGSFDDYSIKFIPSEDFEIQTDSLIDNSVKVSIINRTIKKDPIKVKPFNHIGLAYHKRIESEILICRKDKILFDETLTLKKFIDKSNYTSFWRNAMFEHVWVNQENSTSDNIAINISILNPTNDSYQLFEMRIGKDGYQEITLIEKSA